MLFTEAAAYWIQPYLCAAQDNKDVPMQADYSLFIAKITCVFGDYNEMISAKQKLKKQHQQGSAHVYTVEFQQIASFLA